MLGHVSLGVCVCVCSHVCVKVWMYALLEDFCFSLHVCECWFAQHIVKSCTHGLCQQENSCIVLMKSSIQDIFRRKLASQLAQTCHDPWTFLRNKNCTWANYCILTSIEISFCQTSSDLSIWTIKYIYYECLKVKRKSSKGKELTKQYPILMAQLGDGTVINNVILLYQLSINTVREIVLHVLGRGNGVKVTCSQHGLLCKIYSYWMKLVWRSGEVVR